MLAEFISWRQVSSLRVRLSLKLFFSSSFLSVSSCQKSERACWGIEEKEEEEEEEEEEVLWSQSPSKLTLDYIGMKRIVKFRREKRIKPKSEQLKKCFVSGF